MRSKDDLTSDPRNGLAGLPFEGGTNVRLPPTYVPLHLRPS